MKSVVFGAHSDDYEIGMGGTIAKLVDYGHEVLLVLVTIPNQRKIRLEEAKKAANILGADFIFLDINVDSLSFDRKLVNIFDDLLKTHNPDEIYTHWIYDSHQDHQFISKAIISASRRNDCSVYMYTQTVPSGIVPHTFQDQLFVDISPYIDIKIKSLEAHQSQVENNTIDWIQGVKGRARLHGYQIGVKYAETFEIIKQIEHFSKF